MLIRIEGNVEYKTKVQTSLLAALGNTNVHEQLRWPLPNLKPCVGDDIWRHRAHYSFAADVWCDLRLPDGRYATVVVQYMYHGHQQGGGFAIVIHRAHYPKPSEVEYFTWAACQHDFSETRTGHCQHRYTCSKCGATYDVDSSD